MLPLTSALLIFVGTYTNKENSSRGIYAVHLDPATGAFSPVELAAEARNPTFLTLHPNGRVLYSLAEGAQANGQHGGSAQSFGFDSASGKLTPLNAEATGGLGGCHLTTDSTGRLLLFASYNGGDITAFPLEASGKIKPRSMSVNQIGRLGPNAARQDKPHPHSITLSPDDRFAHVCDLGLDKIFSYRLDPAAATLTAAHETATAPGAGPRHAKFSADGKFFYVINELNSTLAVYACAPESGALAPMQSLSTLPANFTGTNICAEIRLSPDGRFVYGSNRGHDSIAVFSRNETDGTLTLVEIVPCGGKHPRNFNLSPDGRWLVCANRDTNNLVSFRIDAATGRLKPSGSSATIPSPVCVLFAPGK